MIESRFRKLQNQTLKKFSKSCYGKEVIELGGTFKENNSRFFNNCKSFVVTNFYDINCDQLEDVTNLSFKSNSVENVICISVLQHVFDYNKGISEIIRVLKPGGRALITNGFLFPICMDEDYVRLTPVFWEKRLSNEPVVYEIIKLGNRYSVIENLLMRPYGRFGGVLGIINKCLALCFSALGKFYQQKDSYPLGIAIYIEKGI
jgi:SAM-dependent methyltransferase